MKTETHTQTTVTHSLTITFDEIVELFRAGGIIVEDLDSIVLSISGLTGQGPVTRIPFPKGNQCRFVLTPWGM
jgi:hypothetical protein